MGESEELDDILIQEQLEQFNLYDLEDLAELNSLARLFYAAHGNIAAKGFDFRTSLHPQREAYVLTRLRGLFMNCPMTAHIATESARLLGRVLETKESRKTHDDQRETKLGSIREIRSKAT